MASQTSLYEWSTTKRYNLLLLLQSALQPLVGFWPAQLPLTILSRKVLQSAVASGTSNPNLEENQRFRTFQLSPQEAPSVWSDASESSSGKWNYGREMAEKFCRKWRLPRHFWVLLHAVKHDMGQTTLLPLRRKECWGFFRPKNPTDSAGFEPAKLGTKGQDATSRPPKPLSGRIGLLFIFICFLNKFCTGALKRSGDRADVAMTSLCFGQPEKLVPIFKWSRIFSYSPKHPDRLWSPPIPLFIV
jgi:hypothetical protein